MHEASLLKSLMRKIESVAKSSASPKVVAVKVRLGALSHFSEEHFREHFEMSSKGTVADGARLSVVLMTDTQDPLAQDVVLESVEVANTAT